MKLKPRCPKCGKYTDEYIWRPIYDPTPGKNEIKLTPKEAVIYDAVAKRPRTKLMLHELLYGDDPNGGPDQSIIAVFVNKINGVIRKHGRKIKATKPGYLYRLINIDLPQAPIRRSILPQVPIGNLSAQPPACEDRQPKEKGSNHGTGSRLQPARPSS